MLKSITIKRTQIYASLAKKKETKYKKHFYHSQNSINVFVKFYQMKAQVNVMDSIIKTKHIFKNFHLERKSTCSYYYI